MIKNVKKLISLVMLVAVLVSSLGTSTFAASNNTVNSTIIKNSLWIDKVYFESTTYYYKLCMLNKTMGKIPRGTFFYTTPDHQLITSEDAIFKLETVRRVNSEGFEKMVNDGIKNSSDLEELLRQGRFARFQGLPYVTFWIQAGLFKSEFAKKAIKGLPKELTLYVMDPERYLVDKAVSDLDESNKLFIEVKNMMKNKSKLTSYTYCKQIVDKYELALSKGVPAKDVTDKKAEEWGKLWDKKYGVLAKILTDPIIDNFLTKGIDAITDDGASKFLKSVLSLIGINKDELNKSINLSKYKPIAEKIVNATNKGTTTTEKINKAKTALEGLNEITTYNKTKKERLTAVEGYYKEIAKSISYTSYTYIRTYK